MSSDLVALLSGLVALLSGLDALPSHLAALLSNLAALPSDLVGVFGSDFDALLSHPAALSRSEVLGLPSGLYWSFAMCEALSACLPALYPDIEP